MDLQLPPVLLHLLLLTPTTPLRTLGHLTQFSNMTYGEVLSLYQTPSSATRRTVPLSENPKSVSHHYKQVKGAKQQSASGKICLLGPKDVNKSESNEGAAALKRKKPQQPWMNEDLLKKILQNRSVLNKWRKIKRRKCPNGFNDYKGGRCPCQECLEKKNLHCSYTDNKRLIDKLTYEAKVAYFGEEVMKKQKRNKALDEDNLHEEDVFTVPSNSCGSEKCDQQCSEETSASNVKNGLNTASQEMPGKTLVQISDYTNVSKIPKQSIALVTAKETFNPVHEKDFGLQLRCGNYYTVGKNTPSNPEETNVLITNLRYDFNYHDSLINLVKKYGAVKKLYPRFMNMRHIALVQFKQHKSALKFIHSDTSRRYKTQPPMKKFWRQILPVPDEDVGLAADQTHLTTPPPGHCKPCKFVRPPPRPVPHAKLQKSGTANENNKGKTDNFEIHVPAVIPCLEESGLSDPPGNSPQFSAKRKPSLKLMSRPLGNLSNVKSNTEIIDLEVASKDPTFTSPSQTPPVIVIDDDEPTSSKTIPSSSNSLCHATSNFSMASGSPNMVDVPNESNDQDLDIIDPVVTPAGVKLSSHSFKIVPSCSGDTGSFKYILTGSLKPPKDMNGCLIVRGIPYELNRSAGLKQSLSKFGRCKIKPRYMGLRTTAFVRYLVQSNAAACFHELYKLLGHADMKIFWMEKIPVSNSLFPYQSVQGNGKSNDVEIEFVPKNRGSSLDNQILKHFRRMHMKRNSQRNHKLRLLRGSSGVCKKMNGLKNNHRQSILSRLKRCNNPRSRRLLERMLKRLGRTTYQKHNTVNEGSSVDIRIVKTIYNPQPNIFPDQKLRAASDNSKFDVKITKTIYIPPPPNSYPKTIKVGNYFNQDVLINHFKKFGKCSVVSYVVEMSKVVLCKFESRKKALVAFVKGRELVWVEWGNRKEKILELEWEFD